MGEAKIGLNDSARHGCWATVGGAAGSVGGGRCCNLSLKIAVNSSSAEILSSPTQVNGASG
jgi:hypothetical protein